MFLALECCAKLCSMLYVCGRGEMDVVFFVCIVMHGAVGACVLGSMSVSHANVVCLCFVCILWQFSMLRSE